MRTTSFLLFAGVWQVDSSPAFCAESLRFFTTRHFSHIWQKALRKRPMHSRWLKNGSVLMYPASRQRWKKADLSPGNAYELLLWRHVTSCTLTIKHCSLMSMKSKYRLFWLFMPSRFDKAEEACNFFTRHDHGTHSGSVTTSKTARQSGVGRSFDTYHMASAASSQTDGMSTTKLAPLKFP